MKPEEDKGSDAEHALKIKLPFRIFKHNFEAMVLQTMTIQVRNSKAISLLKELETKAELVYDFDDFYSPLK